GGVLLAELVDAAGGVHDLLLTRVEGVAVRADLDLQIMPQGRARLEGVAAGAADGNLFVLGVGGRFHGGARFAETELAPGNGGVRPAIKGRGSLAAGPRSLKRGLVGADGALPASAEQGGRVSVTKRFLIHRTCG